MKSIKIQKYIMLLSIFALTATFFGSCNDYSFPVDDSYNRLFSTTSIEVNNLKPNSADIVWAKIPGVEKYLVEISRDSLAFTNIFYSQELDRSVDTLKLNNLYGENSYSIRIKSLSDSIPESKFNELFFETPGEQIMNEITADKVASSSVWITWKAGSEVTHFVFTTTDGAIKKVTISEDEKAVGEKIVYGLTAQTDYSVRIYNTDDNSRGKGSFTTITSPFGANDKIVDLRGITDRPKVLLDTIPFIESGSVIVLQRNLTYEISTTTAIGKAMKIASSDDFGAPATLYFTSNFIFEEGSNVDSIVFENINIYSDNYTSRYVFNANKTATVGSIKFKTVTANTFRGLVRFQSQPITCTNFIVDNCVMDSIKDYGLINIDLNTSSVENILVTNSTFSFFEKFIISKNNSNSVKVEDCTFYQVPKYGNYLIDYREAATDVVTQGVELKNIIMGPGTTDPATELPSVRGVRVDETSTVTAYEVYATSEYTILSAEIPGLKIWDKASTSVFRDVAIGDFTLIDPSLSSSIGDPRWRP